MTMDAKAFLEALWGDLPQSDGPFIQTWELAQRRSSYYAAAAEVDVDGEPDVFTGVGLAFKRLGANHRAKADEVVAIPGFWLDLDVGPGKCPTRNDAFSLSTAHVSPSIVIDSGHGIHCWYLFEKPWRFRQRSEQERAGIAARQFVMLHQRTATERGWHIDSVGDLARILRLPGTLNAKDPDHPRPVIALGLPPYIGPRYTYSELALLLKDMPLPEPATRTQSISVPGDGSMFTAKLEALRENSPEFEAVLTHQRVVGDGSLSSYDLSLCSLAAGAMNDSELRLLIEFHRVTWGDTNDQAKGRRTKYQDLTIAKARTQIVPAAELRSMARRAA